MGLQTADCLVDILQEKDTMSLKVVRLLVHTFILHLLRIRVVVRMWDQINLSRSIDRAIFCGMRCSDCCVRADRSWRTMVELQSRDSRLDPFPLWDAGDLDELTGAEHWPSLAIAPF